MRAARQWLDLFSEGGPFVVAEEPVFRAWPGSRGWGEIVGALEAPGAVRALDAGSAAFFDPEDPGPAQVGWDGRSLVVVRWFEAGAPVLVRDISDERRAAFDADVARALDGAEEVVDLGTLDLADGLLIVSWAAYGGRDLEGDDRAALEALAAASPPQARRFAGGGPALTAVRLPRGSYAVRGVLDHFDEERERGGSWVRLDPI